MQWVVQALCGWFRKFAVWAGSPLPLVGPGYRFTGKRVMQSYLVHRATSQTGGSWQFALPENGQSLPQSSEHQDAGCIQFTLKLGTLSKLFDSNGADKDCRIVVGKYRWEWSWCCYHGRIGISYHRPVRSPHSSWNVSTASGHQENSTPSIVLLVNWLRGFVIPFVVA